MHSTVSEALRVIQMLVIVCPLAWAFAALTYWVL